VSGSTDHLILGENITLAGLNENTTPNTNTSALVVVSAGTLTMKDGSRITGNTNSTANGGGVYVSAVAAMFTMNGGRIDNNKSTNNAGKGGGVNSAGIFTMNGGTISNNTAGNSSTSSSLQGGGVFIGSNGDFTMNGGIICNNKVLTTNGYAAGGGVHTAKLFTMTGGEISGNEAKIGGGVNIATNADARFNMTGGIITGNTTVSEKGGQVSFYKYITFTKMRGTISGKNDDNTYAIVALNGANDLTKPIIAWRENTHSDNDEELTYTWTTGSLTASGSSFSAGLKNITVEGDWSKVEGDWSK
jgi:hypothetical protein